MLCSLWLIMFLELAFGPTKVILNISSNGDYESAQTGKFLRRSGLGGHVKPAIGGQLKPGHRDSTLISPYSPSSTQVNRHEVLALRFQSLSSVTFEGCLHSVARTSQARLVVPPEPFDAACCERAFRVLLQRPTRDQVLTSFVYIQTDRQHCRPSVHSTLLVSSHCSPYFSARVRADPETSALSPLLPLGIDVQDLARDKTDGLIRGRILQLERPRELRRGDDTVGAFLDPLRDLHLRDLARDDPGLHRHRRRRHRVGLVLNDRRRPGRLLGAAEDHRYPRGQDCQPHPFRHRRLLAKALILSAWSSSRVSGIEPLRSGSSRRWNALLRFCASAAPGRSAPRAEVQTRGWSVSPQPCSWRRARLRRTALAWSSMFARRTGRSFCFSPTSMRARRTIWRLTGSLSAAVAFPAKTRAPSRTSCVRMRRTFVLFMNIAISRSEEHTSELQSRLHLVCRLLLEKKKNN